MTIFTIFTNTGSSRMTAAFYNEMRKMEVEDVRDDDTLRLVSMVSIAVSQMAPAPLPTAAPRAAASVPDHDDRSVALLERSVLARVMWDQRGMET